MSMPDREPAEKGRCAAGMYRDICGRTFGKDHRTCGLAPTTLL
jgi:ferritin-like protein